jgi:hypothetical protein
MNIGKLWRNRITLRLRKRLGRKAFDDWNVSRSDLFGRDPVEGSLNSMYCFTIVHYVHFLDNVSSLRDLIEGLFQLSPFVDDALAVAEYMSEADFAEFKLALISERKAALDEGESIMPERYNSLVLPSRFAMAIILADRGRVSLGPALIRIMETEL